MNAVFDDVFRADEGTSRPRSRKYNDLIDEDMGNLIPVEARKKKDKADQKAEKSKSKKKSLWDEDDIKDAIRGQQDDDSAESGFSSDKLKLYAVIAAFVVLIVIILGLVLSG